ncbi:hypothetical protein Taro_035242 [Colocasia esculenta]|uniref:Uncharacterized protein n=1 Tax=Colocasia esculenta TaxID=4460 RepID=A0A843W621_COLES|nr:hypothetical protein [Colocasia esculenta]
MMEIKGGVGAKPKPAQGRDDAGKGKGAPLSPQAWKKKGDVSGFKAQAIPAAKQRPAAPVYKPEEGKGKASSSSSTKTVTKTTTKTTVRVRSEKKVYTLPGQKYDPPEEREPLRIFYESLSKQIPSSEMAEFWMMEHGLLSPEKAKRAYEKKQRQKTGTPIKSTKPDRPESSRSSQALKSGDIKAKKRVNYSDDDDDFIVKHKKAKG